MRRNRGCGKKQNGSQSFLLLFAAKNWNTNWQRRRRKSRNNAKFSSAAQSETEGKTNQAVLDQHGLDDEKGLGEKL